MTASVMVSVVTAIFVVVEIACLSGRVTSPTITCHPTRPFCCCDKTM